ncbi:MAG: glycine cleavage system protein GcvH [Pseudomonadota bacterium]
MNIPSQLRYAPSHEWVRKEADGTLTVGISDHAQEVLGDLVFIQLPEVGRTVKATQDCAVVESVKAAADVYAPVGGEVITVNQAVVDHPEQVNEDAYSAWLFKIKPNDPAQFEGLLDAAGYQAVVDASN